MQYRENPGNKDQLSILGYGCLRYSKKGTAIDQEKAEREMAAAVEAGVNYFDTAYTYGGSEACLGKFLAKGYRDKVKIATKLPHYYIKAEGDMERYFKEQLERLQTDHVEYYLMHMLNDIAAWERLTALGIQDWIAEKKKSGQIGNIGFSFHGGATQFKKIIDSYDWDFCQIQYNYMDEHTQAGTEGLKYAAAKGLPVIIMEPVKGGSLVNLPDDAKKIFDDLHGGSPASYAIRFAAGFPGILMVLSGMSDIKQMKDNISFMQNFQPLTDTEMEAVRKVQDIFRFMHRIACTACRCCTDGCPQHLPIRELLEQVAAELKKKEEPET